MTRDRLTFAATRAALPRRPLRRPGLALLATLGLALGAAAASAQETAPGAGQQQEGQQPGAQQPGGLNLREEQVQDWTLVCGSRQEGGPEQCEMRQRNDRVMAVVGRLPGRSEPGMLIFVPLGIILPAGVVLQIDAGPERRLQVQRCVPESCQVELILEDDLLRMMRNGTRATFTYAVPDSQGQVQEVEGQLSLLGFTAALDRVEG